MNPAMVLGTALVVVLAMLQPLSAQSSRGDAASGRLYAMNWCTECHSSSRKQPAPDDLHPTSRPSPNHPKQPASRS